MSIRESELLAGRIANIVLGAVGSLSVLIMLYSVVHFQGRDSISADRLLICFLIPSVVVALSFAGLRWETQTKIGVSLVFLSVGLSLYGVEAFLSTSSDGAPAEWFTYKSPEERSKIAKKFGVDFDTRSKLEVIRDLRRKEIETYPYASTSFLLQDQADGTVKSPITIDGQEVVPLGAVSNVVTVVCNETGEYVIYKSDRYGFNNPKGIWDSGATIAAVGDSFTHGSCVVPDKQFVSLIRKHYPATINLGGGGHGPLSTLATIKEYVAHIKPPIVLWFYFEGNDMEDLDKEKDSPLLSRYLQREFTQDLRSRQKEIDDRLKAYIESVKKEADNEALEYHGGLRRTSLGEALMATVTLSHLRQKLWQFYDGYRNTSASESGGALKARGQLMLLFRDILLEAKTVVASWNGVIYFVYLPQWERYARPALASKNREEILSAAAELGIAVVEIDKAFKMQEDPLALFPFRQNAHYNEAGNRVVANEVMRAIAPKLQQVSASP